MKSSLKYIMTYVRRLYPQKPQHNGDSERSLDGDFGYGRVSNLSREENDGSHATQFFLVGGSRCLSGDHHL